MRHYLSFFSVIMLAFLCVQCVTLDSQFNSIDSATEITGTWTRNSGETVEFPLTAKDGIYLKVVQPQKKETQLWNDYAVQENLTIEDVWPRRHAMLSKIYGREYPAAFEDGTQQGLKLKMDKSGEIFSSFVTLVPQSLVLDGEHEVKVAENHKAILYRGKVYKK